LASAVPENGPVMDKKRPVTPRAALNEQMMAPAWYTIFPLREAFFCIGTAGLM